MKSVKTFISDGLASFKAPLPKTGRESPKNKGTVSAIQHHLNTLGFQAGEEDGIVGPKTANAIRAYQRTHGLHADGEASQALLEHLGGTDFSSASHTSSPLARTRLSTGDAHTESSSPSDTRIDLPAYKVGTTFIYSDGNIEQVVGLDGQRVKWRYRDGSQYITDRNFLLPFLYWETAVQRGRSIIRSPVLKNPGNILWPPEAGNRVSFEVEKTIVSRGESEKVTRRTERWECMNGARVRAQVIAGAFDTVKFICRSTGSGGSFETLVWYYAPAIHYFVRFEQTRGSGITQERELVAVQPVAPDWPTLARAQLEKQVVEALANLASGGERQWTSTGVAAQVSIKIGSDFSGRAGAPCRTYVQTWKTGDDIRRYPGVACRNKSGQWRLPIQTDSSSMPLAISSKLS